MAVIVRTIYFLNLKYQCSICKHCYPSEKKAAKCCPDGEIKFSPLDRIPKGSPLKTPTLEPWKQRKAKRQKELENEKEECLWCGKFLDIGKFCDVFCKNAYDKDVKENDDKVES